MSIVRDAQFMRDRQFLIDHGMIDHWCGWYDCSDSVLDGPYWFEDGSRLDMRRYAADPEYRAWMYKTPHERCHVAPDGTHFLHFGKGYHVNHDCPGQQKLEKRTRVVEDRGTAANRLLRNGRI